MKKYFVLITFLTISSISLRAQVAINTNGANPNASAMLDITSTNKGLLIPRIYLNSAIDNTTIPNPATSLMIYNTNASMARGAGFYYNAGTAAAPNWQSVHDLVLPFSKATSAAGTAFTIENYSQNAASVAIKGNNGGAGKGVEGIAVSGTGVYAKSFSGNALEVDGKLKIAGNGQAPAAGKILTSDAAGNASWEGNIAFSAKGVVNTGSHVIAEFQETKVRFASTKYDLGGNYSGPNAGTHSVFTVPTHGIYHFDVRVTWYVDNYSNGYVSSNIRCITNGQKRTLATITTNPSDNFYEPHPISIDIELQPGDQIFVEVDHNLGEYMNIASDEASTFFNARMVIKL